MCSSAGAALRTLTQLGAQQDKRVARVVAVGPDETQCVGPDARYTRGADICGDVPDPISSLGFQCASMFISECSVLEYAFETLFGKAFGRIGAVKSLRVTGGLTT